MAEGTAYTAWLQSPKWYESKKGEVTENISDVQANFWFGVGVAIIPNGRTEAVEVKEYEKNGEKNFIVKVSIALYNRNYETLISFGNNPVSRIMTHIEKGDYVFAIGKKKKSHYKNRKGEEKEKTEVYVSFVIPLGHIEAIQEMYTNPNIQMVMNGSMPNMTATAEEADEMEMVGYDEESYENEPDFEIPDQDEFETITEGLPFV